ncbi:hypothetical protein WJX84_011565 [Apatococcus fuscideae]|uniref:ATP-dependent RNA helicase n=1 Tax=Apatococcus fuscideae TaxID=2026836 RepID=A0AAW1T2E5_9CHLO
MSESGDIELNVSTAGPNFRKSYGLSRSKKHSKTFKKQSQLKQLRRENRANKPKILNAAGSTTQAAAGALKGYDLGPAPGEQQKSAKRQKVTSEGQPAKESTAAEQAGTVPPAAQAAAVFQKKPVVFGGEAKALAELIDEGEDFEEEPLEAMEVEEGMTDILAAVQASQLRDRQFTVHPSGQVDVDYHSSDEDDGEGVAGAIPPLLKAARQARLPRMRPAQPVGHLDDEHQQQQPQHPATYKEGLAQSNAAKGPKLQPHGPSESKSFRDLGVCQSLADHLAEHGLRVPRQIQRASIPTLLSAEDLVIQNLEASGKTYSYLIAIINQLQGAETRISREAGTHAIILAPSVSVCSKVEAALQILLKRYFWLVGGAMHGSEARNKEKARLRRGVTVLVCTPGRLLDHLQHTEAFRTADLRWLVLDDVDQMLETDACHQLGQIFELLRDRSKRPSQHWQNILVMRKRKLPDWSALATLKLDNPVLATCREPKEPRPDFRSKPLPDMNKARAQPKSSTDEPKKKLAGRRPLWQGKKRGKP